MAESKRSEIRHFFICPDDVELIMRQKQESKSPLTPSRDFHPKKKFIKTDFMGSYDAFTAL